MTAPDTATPETPPAEPQAPAAAAPAPVKKSLEDSLATLDEETRTYVLNEVSKARREAGDSRVAAKTQAAEEARTEMAQAVGKALGLIKDEPADPAKLVEQLTSVGAEARQAKVELAIFHAASGVNADPIALLDSRSFLAKVADIDPTDPAAVAAAVGQWVTENPAFLKNQPVRIPGPNPAQGASANGAPSVDDQIAAAVKAGDVKTQIRLQNQKLSR